MIFLRLIGDSISFAFSSLINNKLRTFLSLLGITIGIFCIISVMTTIDSLERSVRTSFMSLGGDIIYIQKFPWIFDEGGEYPWWKFVNRPLPKTWEAEKLKELSVVAENIAFCASTVQQASYEGKSVDNVYVSLFPFEYNQMKDLEIEKGRYFTQLESNSGRNVALIGSTVAERLFENADPVGTNIKIGSHKITIIGVLKKTGTAMFDDGTDDSVIIPLSYGKTIYNVESPGLDPHIMINVKEGLSMEMLIDEITVLMRNIRKLKPLEDDNFSINQSSMFSQILDRVFGVLDIAGVIIGGFAILVGGFGIANIMFVSVKERTKQIGIQKAIGAKSYLILIQFLTEAVVLCLVGGIVGLLLVWLLMTVASSLVSMDLALSLQNILTGTLISVIIGIVSGYAPARQAAKLDPVIAMNHV